MKLHQSNQLGHVDNYCYSKNINLQVPSCVEVFPIILTLPLAGPVDCPSLKLLIFKWASEVAEYVGLLIIYI